MRLLPLCAGLMITTATTVSANDFVEACHDFGSAEVVFVGRAISAPTTRRVSAEHEIEKARLAFTAAERELKAFEAQNLPPEVGRARQVELARRAMDARTLYGSIEAAHPTVDMSVTPMLVEVPFRGATVADVLMWSNDGEPGIDPIDPSRSYLIYATRPFGAVAPDIVSGHARAVETAESHLRFLNAASANSVGSVVYGSLRVENPTDPHRMSPLGGVTLRVSIEDRTIETATTSEGTFMITGLPPGKVSLAPLLPDHLMLPVQALSGQVRAGCLAFHMRAKLNGRIRGTVLLDSGAAFDGRVDLVSTDGANVLRSTVPTNNRGEFVFNGLSPGRYLLGINLLTEPAPGVPFRPTYFPGTTDRTHATPVLVGEGTEHNEVDWVVTSRIGVGSVEVSLDAHGEPQMARGVCVIKFGNDNRSKGGSSSLRTSSDPMIIEVLEGTRYRLIAHAQTASGFAESESFDVIGTVGHQAITLRLASITQKDSGNPCSSRSAHRDFSPPR